MEDVHIWPLATAYCHEPIVNVNAIVAEELELIPRGDFEQNELRMLYQMKHSRALGAKSEELLTVRETLERATAMIRRDVTNVRTAVRPAPA